MTTSKSSLGLGTVLDGKFRITREVGRGGMASVYEAENIDIGKRVAVKLLSADLAHSEVVTERFIREARAAARIRSPHICEVYDVGTYQGRPFIVMELLEGESLYEKLVTARVLPAAVALGIAADVASGLGKAHDAGIVHRDLKPENIFLAMREDGTIYSKILDFGLAKYYESNDEQEGQARLTKHGALFGTPAYMSPEQARAQGEVDHRSDLWAFGCIVYEMLTGHTVWDIKQGVAMIFAQIATASMPVPSHINPQLPKSFDNWFVRALNRDQHLRFQTASQMALALAEALAGDESLKSGAMSVDATPPTRITTPYPAPSPRPLPPATLAINPSSAANDDEPVRFRSALPRGVWAAAALVVLAGGAALFWRSRPEGLIEFGRNPQAAPLEREPYAQALGQAQALLGQGQARAALGQFQQVFQQSKDKKVARSFIAHVEASLEQTTPGQCRLAGIGHPRPFDTAVPSSRPTIASLGTRVVSAWVDNHVDATEQHLFTTLLDSELRRVTEIRNLTPEGKSIRSPQLVVTGDRVAVLYWDSGGDRPGVFTRVAGPEVTALGSPTLISPASDDEYFPSLASDADGTNHWALFSMSAGPKTRDLMAQRLDQMMLPLGPPVRLTALAPGKTGAQATRPAVSLAGGQLSVAFALDRKGARSIALLRVNPATPAFSSGGVSPPATAGADAENDRYLGQTLVIGSGRQQAAHPQLACNSEGCLIAWDGPTTAELAFIEHAGDRLTWRRSLEGRATRPTVAAAGEQFAAAWFHERRVHFASLTHDQARNSQIVAKISGSRYEPIPQLIAGNVPGQWLLSWRDFEAGNQEPFVARVDCTRVNP